MIINATQIREGMILVLDNELYRVTWTMHRTPGKGNAVMQTKLKQLVTGKNLEQRFMSDARVERAELETREMQYLFEDTEAFTFMDTQSYEQIQIEKSIIGDQSRYLLSENMYMIIFYKNEPIGLELPQTVVLTVTYAPPELRKATATNSLRPVTVENGMQINAPAFIKEGDQIKVRTETDEYMERVTK